MSASSTASSAELLADRAALHDTVERFAQACHGEALAGARQRKPYRAPGKTTGRGRPSASIAT